LLQGVETRRASPLEPLNAWTSWGHAVDGDKRLTERIAIGGSIARRARVGGHAWALFHYALGLRRLGFEVTFVDSHLGEASAADWPYVSAVLEETGLSGDYGLLDADEVLPVGLDRTALLERGATAAGLINVMGYVADEEIHEAVPHRVFLDIDPGYPQMWHELGLADMFAGHSHFVTIGENIGRPDCDIPTCGFDWITTPPPVVLDHWPVVHGGRAFTSVVSWRGPYGTVECRGKTYGSRVHEFRKFVELPRLVDAEFELALDIHPDDSKDRDLLEQNGWRLVDPRAVAGDPWSYRSYIQQSRAEFGVAQNIYVETRSGWISDRSLCYLASGKPVLAQDTGFSDNYPVGEGLLAFSTLEEAAAGVEEIETNYERHSRAARALAEEYFDSDKVLTRLLARLGIPMPVTIA
jgi:hypothetical protein